MFFWSQFSIHRAFVQFLCSYSTLPLYAIVAQVRWLLCPYFSWFFTSCEGSHTETLPFLVLEWRWEVHSRGPYLRNIYNMDWLNGHTKPSWKRVLKRMLMALAKWVLKRFLLQQFNWQKLWRNLQKRRAMWERFIQQLDRVDPNEHLLCSL